MKVLKNVFLVVGLLVVIGAGVMAGIVTGIHLPVLVRVARANNTGQAPLTDPTSWVLIGMAAAVVGGLLVGLGIGLPRRTANAVRHETIEELHRQTTADAAAQAAALHQTAQPDAAPETTDRPRTEPHA